MKNYACLLFVFISFVFISCDTNQDEPEPVINNRYYEMYVGETCLIDGENLDGIDWRYGNLYVAEIFDNTKIKANYVGTTVYHSAKGWILVDVLPKYNDYSLPIIFYPVGVGYGDKVYRIPTYKGDALWGWPRISVKMLLEDNGYKYNSRYSNDKLQIYDTNNPKSPYLVYSFENDKMVGAGVLVDIMYSGNISQFLYERYIISNIDMVNNTALFVHAHSEDNEPVVDMIGSMAFSSSIGGVLLFFEPPVDSKGISGFNKAEMSDFLSEIEMSGFLL